jgi:outer membrane protein assembly factor BamD (BamD/ComL family)
MKSKNLYRGSFYHIFDRGNIFVGRGFHAPPEFSDNKEWQKITSWGEIKMFRATTITLFVLLAAAIFLAAERAPASVTTTIDPIRLLASADKFYAEKDAGMAMREYRRFLRDFFDHARADYAIYMIGQSSQLALEQMGGIIPAYLIEKSRGSNDFDALEKYLAKEYGFHEDLSEGDPYWHYDMRAYRELLKRFPKSKYADDAEFLLVEPEQGRAWAIGMGPERAETAKNIIAKYRALLKKYPDTNREREIEKKIAELKPLAEGR